MTPKKLLSLTLAWSLSSSAIFGAALVFDIDSGSDLLRDMNGVLLTAGGEFNPGDGAIVQLGYFTGATSDNNNFAGDWVPLTGEGSSNFVQNTVYDTTVGDDQALVGGAPAAGIFVILGLIMDTTIQTNLPPVGTILSIRVYDKTSLIAPDLNFMTISNNLWKWRTPGSLIDPNSKISMSFDQRAGLRAEDRLAGGGTSSTPSGTDLSLAGVPRPTIPVPEPSSVLLAFAGCVAFIARRRK